MLQEVEEEVEVVAVDLGLQVLLKMMILLQKMGVNLVQ